MPSLAAPDARARAQAHSQTCNKTHATTYACTHAHTKTYVLTVFTPCAGVTRTLRTRLGVAGQWSWSMHQRCCRICIGAQVGRAGKSWTRTSGSGRPMQRRRTKRSLRHADASLRRPCGRRRRSPRSHG